jgi:hydroxymethylpyrimidine pyrophosphatase-like HAD family hydrolase
VEDEHEEASLGISGGELTPGGLPAARARFKLLAVDLDGTLLTREGIPHEADRLAIGRLRDAGVPTTIVTGRLYSGSEESARVVGIEGPIGCVDGSQIVDTRNGREVFVRSIESATARLVRDLLVTHGAVGFLFAQDLIVHDSAGEPFAHYVRTWSPRVEVVGRVTEHPHWEHADGVMAVVALGTSAQILPIVSTLRSELSHATFVVDFPVARLAGTHALVARAAGATKGTAIEWLARGRGGRRLGQRHPHVPGRGPLLRDGPGPRAREAQRVRSPPRRPHQRRRRRRSDPGGLGDFLMHR